MGCVNRSSKEFKDLALRHNLDTNTLELITHKYWLETGNETLFPTDVYIQAQLGNGQYQEDGKSVRKLWERDYSHPLEYSTLGEVQAAQRKAFRYFPKSAVYFYKNAKGTYILSVKKPVAKIKHDKESFFMKLDNMESPSDIKTLDLGIKDDRPYGIETVQNLYNRFNNDRTTKDLADKVFKLAKDLGISFSFNDTLPRGIVGRYENNNTITYKKSFLESNMENDKKAPIILHELLHAVSSYALSDKMDANELSEPMQKFRVEMNSLYQDLKNNPTLKGERGIVNVKEFVAELSNPVFRAKIKEIDKENKPKRTFWQRVLDAFKSLLNLHVTSSYYERSMKALENALNAFNVDSYMRYNNIKAPLREGFNAKKWNYITLGSKLKKEVSEYFDNKSDNTINNNDSRLENKNIMQYEQGITAAGKVFKEIYSLFQREEHRDSKANEGKATESKSLRARSHEEAARQQKQLVKWAEKNNKSIYEPNDYFDEELGEQDLNGTEAKVWVDPDRDIVIKSITPAHYQNVKALLDRIAIHNIAFPTTTMSLRNIGISDDGVSVIVEQPYIKDSDITPTLQEIEDYMTNTLGFTLTKGKGINAEYSKDGYTVADIRPENVIKQPDGTLAVIDCFAKFNEETAMKPLTIGEFVKSLSDDSLKDELHLIEQEYDDYDLSNGIKEEENKKSSKAVPQDFTFNDDTVVKAPFMPNGQQIDALNAMSDFIKSRETSMTLSGYAGTGKTSLMEMIAKKCKKQGRPVMFCATTNKAAAVLNDRVSKAGFKATTLNKTFGINVEIDPNAKNYNARNLVNNLKEVDIMPGTTIIIDEASMINEENYRILNMVAEENNLKIIYVGDEAQLAPVNEEKISKVFRNGDGKVVRLTQVERTDDNAILKEATAIRNGEPLSGETSFNSKGEGVAYISPEHQDAINKVIEHYVKGLKKDPNHFRILAYTNKAVSDYNNQVRKLLGYEGKEPQRDEPMVGYNNWGYVYDSRTRQGTYRFINSESYKVTSVGKPKKVSTTLSDGTMVEMEALPLTLTDSLGNVDTFDYMDIKSNPQNRQSAMLIANEKKNLWAMTSKVYGREAKAKLYQKINDLDKFLFVNDDLEDSSHNLLQKKTIDFGYALTIHKSQGSTFTNVLMDDVDVSRAAWGNDASKAMETVTLEGDEARNNPNNAEITSTEDVDLGDLSDVTEAPKQNDQAANIKQQLEYVGVSRATDTVTIVSNHIKKEGSPLDPKKGIKEDTIKENGNRSSSNNNNNVSNETEYKATDEFRRVREASRKLSQEQISRMRKGLSDDDKRRLGGLLGRQLDTASNGGWYNHRTSLAYTNEKKGLNSKFDIGEVNTSLFHDIFEIVRTYLKNGELVDLHDDYSDCKCFVTKDGLAGFAIEPDGNLVSVYSLNPKENGGFLHAIKDMVREEGATHLDAYESSMQPLQEIYSKTLGFYTAATMDYNMEYDHDDIAKNHGNPQVVFMVDHEVENPRHFDKDSYDAAKEYQMEQLEDRKATPTSQEAQSYTVKLPGYEYFNDLYEDTTVDAEWKIPYLKELDAQLSNDNSGEENQNILDQMDNILQSTSKEEYLQQLSSSKVSKTKRKISEYEKLNKQLDNLLEGGDEDYEEFDAKLPASEVRHAAAQAMDYISDEITRLQKEEGLAKKLFPSLSTDLDFQTATRRQIVETVGINRLLDRAKALFDSEAVDYDDLNVSMQANLIFDNWDAIVKMGSDVFAFNEGFGITKDYSNGRFGTTDDSKMDYDNFNDYSNDPEIAAEEGEKDEQEKWQIDVKTVDVLNSMSALVRQGIHDCYLLDENGEKVMSKWLIPERVDPREAVNSILRWTQGALTLDAMIERLTDKQQQNPWLSQLITRLSDKSGKETDFQSQFFGVFEKHFQLYTIVLQENGKYHSMAVNSHPALSDIMKSITSKYKIGEHTLFNGNKVNSNLLGSKEDGKDAKFSLHKALNELREITKTLDSGKALDDEMTKAATGNIIEVCKALGFDEVTEDMVTDVLNAENIKKETEYLGYIVKSLDAAQRAQDKGELKDYEPFGFKKKHSIDGSLKNFLTPITDRLEDTAVNAFYDSGKMYQSRVTPSFLSKLMNKLKLEGKKFEEFMADSYASSEWYAFNKTGEFGKIEWRNEWLRLLANDESARKVFDHQVELNFNKHNYMRNMSDTEYTLSLITQYFGVSTSNSDSMVPAWFRVPMQSNKPSSDFIKFYSYRGLNYKRSIVRGLHDIFLQELSRIQTVRMRNLGKKDWGFIKNFDTNGRKFNFLPMLNAYLENTSANKARREMLHNGVEYDAKRLDELKQKENIWKEEVRKSKEWQEDYVSQKTDEDFLYEKDKDPVILQENERVKSYQLSLEQAEELRILEGKKEADDRRLSTEEDDKFASLLQKKLKGEEALTSDEEASFGNLADKIIRQYMENRVQSILDNWEEKGILDAAKSVQGIYPTELNDEDAASYVREQVENFLWNDALASKNILELTIGDIAFYKDTEDLQKRLAQLHAPGIRGRIDATDYEGNRVSDGKYRTFILKDFDTFKSNIIANISEVFDRKIAEADDSQKPQMIALKESLVGKDGKYTKINVTDAQGYSSPASYRKKAFIFGRWSRDAEKTYQRIKSGDYTLTDFETAFQPLKPFVYSMLDKNLGVDNAPIHNMKVPFQAKNAEYLLIMADAILQGEKLSRPNLLRAVYRVMEDSEKMNPTMGIDTVQFESAIKSGLQGQMDIALYKDIDGGEDMAYDYMMNNIYKTVDGKLTKDYDTDTFVHETSYEDYCLQQEVPEHFKLHSQAHGSQIRMITPSDLDLYTTDENGNQVDNYYTWKEPNGTVKKMKADEFRKEYEKTIADNIEESITDLVAELHLDSADKKERNIALSEILQKEIVSSPRYGLDMMQACSVDENGEFRIPKGDPIQAKRIEQLINSIIKNRVNKQKIAGGPIVQVSNFGTSRQLHIRFNDRQGNLMPLEEEYNPSEHDGLSYKDYCKKNQGGIAYFEVFCPMWNDEIYEKFSNPDGTINIDAINAMDPEYLKMVSYRIPTEDKYSCAPMKVVGFMPRWAGDAIMLPYELTEIDDSDFDVDKRYVMRKDIPIKTKRRRDIETELFKRASESYKKAHDGKTANEKIGEQVRMFMDNPQKMKNADSLMKWLYKQYQSIAYYTEAPTSGRQYRDNKIIDMTYAVLTNERTADKILNPGGFDAPKKMGYMVAAYKNPSNNVKWEDLEKMSIQELKDLSYTDKDLTFADTQVQFYKQNSAAASLIGVFAVNKVAHATLESNGINLCISDICGDTPISIAGTTFGNEVAVKAKDKDGNDITIKKRMQVIDAKYDSQGTLIGKTLGSLVSASADAVKDPILNLMNVNMTTAGMLNTMLRFGMPFNDAALFLSQDIIERLLSQFNRENLSNYVTLDGLIDKWLDYYREKEGLQDNSIINSEPLTKDELVEGLTSDEHEKIDYKVLLAYKKLKALTDAMRKPTYTTRFNSISSAVGPLIVDNLIMEHKMENFRQGTMPGDTPFFSYDDRFNDWIPVDIDDIFTDHPVLQQFSKTVDIAKSLFSDMPTGSNGFRSLISKLPKDISDKMYGDKKLLDDFSNFYQSYLLIQSGVVNPGELRETVTKFPKEFIEKGYKEKYKGNAFIDAIRLNVSKSGTPFLQINLTGIDEPAKEKLRFAWVDLHKDNPELSKKLFDYSFFRAGIGFSPKTFMSLVPLYVKERLKNGNASYVDTYRNFPTIVPELVIDQFIRNNWENTKLVPWRGDKNTKYNVDIKHDRLTVYREEDKKDVENLTYMKTNQNKVAYLWHNVGKDTNGDIVFERIKPLGNNGEYLEMDVNKIVNPLSETLKAEESNETSDLQTPSPQESNAEETSSTSAITQTEQAKKLDEIVDLIQKQVPRFSKEKATDKFNEIKDGNVRQYRKFLQNVFKQKGLELNEEEAINEFKKYC